MNFVNSMHEMYYAQHKLSLQSSMLIKFRKSEISKCRTSSYNAATVAVCFM